MKEEGMMAGGGRGELGDWGGGEIDQQGYKGSVRSCLPSSVKMRPSSSPRLLSVAALTAAVAALAALLPGADAQVKEGHHPSQPKSRLAKFSCK